MLIKKGVKAIKNSDLNKTIRDIKTCSISKNKTIQNIENKDYDTDEIHNNIKPSFESKNKIINSMKNKDYDADKKLAWLNKNK